MNNIYYENGYRAGHEEGYDIGWEDGYKAGKEINRTTGFWKWTKDGNRICSECGMLEPDSLPGACAIYPSEKRYCFFCGARLIYPREQ